MSRDAFDGVFESDLSRDEPVASEGSGAPDLVGDVLDRVDRHRSYVTPSQRRRVLIGRWLLSGAGVLALLLSALAYDTMMHDPAHAGLGVSEAGIVPVSGQVRLVNDRLRDQIAGLVNGSAESHDETHRQLAQRVAQARADARQPATTAVTIRILHHPTGADDPNRWELRIDDRAEYEWTEGP